MWESIKNWWNRESDHLAFAYIQDGEPLLAGNAYFRVWLADMFLAKARDWGQDQWPAVHATVQLAYAGQDRARFTRVAQPPKEQLGVGVRQNYHLTPLLPFSGGIVEIESALIQLHGANPVRTAISVLEDFSALVGAPLSTALAVANKIATGVTTLAENAGGQIELGLHQAFVAAGGNLDNELRPGYLAVIGAPASDVELEGLTVRDATLHGGDGNPLVGFDYMLFGIESRTTRDDYSSLFADEFNAAKEAAIWNQEEQFKEKSRLLYLAVYTSDDLTDEDRQVQIAIYRSRLQEAWDTALGAAPDDDTDDLDDLIARTPIPDVLARVTLDDLLAM